MIRPVVGHSAPGYHGNGISADAMPMMYIGGGDRRSEERIQYLRRAVETEPTRQVRIEAKPRTVIESKLELSKKEKKTIWYTRKELSDMLGSNKELIQLSRKKPEADVCTRGLEDMMSIRASLNKKERRNGVLHAVLEEQKKQQAENIPNPEKLRKRSKNASKESVKRALQFAHIDARTAACDDGIDSRCGSLSLPDFNKKDICCSDDATVATMTTATTMTTCSTTSTFESNFRRRGGVDSVVQQPNTPSRSSSCPDMPPMSVVIDTSGIVADRKAKKLVLRPKEQLNTSGHRSTSGRNRIPSGSGRGRTQGGL